MPLVIEWSSEPYIYQNLRYYLNVKTGATTPIQNTLMSLRMVAPLEALDISQTLENAALEAGKQDNGFEGAPNIPFIVVYSRETARGIFSVTLMWGIVLNGGRRKSALTGDWIFMVSRTDEAEQVLSSVFHFDKAIERMLDVR